MKTNLFDRFKNKLPSKKLLESVLDESKYASVLASVLKMLKKTDPVHAGDGEAKKIVEEMKRFARQILKKKV